MPKQSRSTTPTGQQPRTEGTSDRVPSPPPESGSRSRSGSEDRPDGAFTTSRTLRASSGQRVALAPATVWPSPPTGRSWPTGVIEDVVTAFSRPGDRVIVLAHPDTETPSHDTGHSRRDTSGLRARPAVPRGWALEAAEIGIRLDRHTRVRMLNHLPGAPTDPPGQSGTSHRLAGGRGGEPTLSASSGVDVESGAAHLLITVVAADEVPAEATGVLWATLLRTGGILAVLTHSYHDGTRLVDPTGPIVTAGQNADLLYLQHIVAVHEPLPTGTHTAPGDGCAIAGDEVGPPVAHRRSHSDVLVFQQPAAHASGYYSAATGGAG